MPAQGPSVWLAALAAAISAGFARVVAWLPSLLGAIVILLLGWGIGKLIQALVVSILRAVHFERLSERAGIDRALQRAEIKTDATNILGVIAYWFIFLLAISAAIGVLGIEVLSVLMTTVVAYIPLVFAAIVIIVIGAWAASFLGRLTRGAAMNANVPYADLLGGVVQGIILFFTFAIALDTLGISFPFLTTAFAIVLGALGLAFALSFGLGGREYAEDLVAGRQLKSLFNKGDRMTTPDVDGTIEDITPTMTLIRTSRGDVAVQNRELMQTRLTRHTRGEGGSMGQAA